MLVVAGFDHNLESEDILDQNVDSMMSEGNYYGEMATIAIGEKLNINVNPETERLSIAYFKVLNAESFRKATKVARLHFKDSGMEYHKDGSGKQPWILNSQELKRLLKLLKSNHTDNDGYTNWQIACYQWNLENGLIKQGMPETWIYDPSKGKK